MPDIDIDFADRSKALNVIKHIKASRTDNERLVPHNTVVYLQRIPHDPVNNLSGIEYKSAERRGYYKVDFLNVNIYSKVKDDSHLKHLMETEPLWDLLLQDDFTDLLFHVNGHGSLLRQMKPASVEELAMCLALIRPAKSYSYRVCLPLAHVRVLRRPALV
jgi:DNA polymerase III alpha subunit